MVQLSKSKAGSTLDDGIYLSCTVLAVSRPYFGSTLSLGVLSNRTIRLRSNTVVKGLS
jgi:hypothetical protein